MRRIAPRSTWRLPGNSVHRVDRCTGLQSAGSRQSQMTPRAQGCSWSCAMTRVGTEGGRSPARMAAAAASASANQVRTCSAYTPGKKSSATATDAPGCGRGDGAGGAQHRPGSHSPCAQQPTCAHAHRVWGSGRRLLAAQADLGRRDVTGEAKSPGNGSARSSSSEAAIRWSGCAKLSGRLRAASQAACPTGPRAGPSTTHPSHTVGRLSCDPGAGARG